MQTRIMIAHFSFFNVLRSRFQKTNKKKNLNVNLSHFEGLLVVNTEKYKTQKQMLLTLSHCSGLSIISILYQE